MVSVKAQIWDAGALDLSETQRQLLPQVRQWLLKRYPATTSAGFSWKSNEKPSVAHRLLRDIRPLSKAVEALRILNKVAVRLQELQLDRLPPLPVGVLCRRPKNPLATDIGNSLTQFYALQLALERWLEALTSEVPIECVAFSAILYGGLLHTSSVLTLIRSLTQVHTSQQKFYLDLSLPWRGEENMEDRRWYLDPLTASLLLRLGPTATDGLLAPAPDGTAVSDDRLKKRLWSLLLSAIRTHAGPQSAPESLSQLLAIASVAARIEIPAIVVSYATRSVVSHSLKPQALLRLQGEADSIELGPDRQPHQKYHQLRLRLPRDNGESEPLWMLALRRALSGSDKKTMLRALQPLLESVAQEKGPARYMTEFAYTLCKDGSAAGHKLAASTVRAYVLTIARRLIGLLEEKVLEKLSLATLLAAYSQALDDAVEEGSGRGLRRNVALSLREFHIFLHNAYSFPTVADQEVFGLARGLVPVDANLISYDEYQRALHYIDESTIDPSLKRVARIILILAFRCGLRRMEMLGLRIDDLQEREHAELFIRPSAYRQLKTKSSTRRIPLALLMGPKDLDFIGKWKEHRIQKHRASGQDHLFSIPELNFNPVPEDTIIPIIHAAIREASGDPSLHLHHLRHSFATWTFLRLLLSDFPRIPNLLPSLPRTSLWLQHSKAFRTRLYGNDFPTRKHAFAVASLLGHSSPDVSLEHYIHCMDWLLQSSLASSPLLAPTKALLASASNRSRRTASRWFQKGGTDAVPAHLASHRLLAREVPVTLPPTNSAPPPTWIENVWDLLFQFEAQRVPLLALAKKYAIPPPDARAIIARARRVRDQRSNHGAKGFVYEMTIHQGKRLCCPRKPSSPPSLEVARHYYPLLEILHEQGSGIPEVLAYYVDHIRRRPNLLIFRDPTQPEAARAYLAFLRDLGISIDAVRFVSFDHTKKRSQHAAAWRSALSLSEHPIEKEKLPSGNSSKSIRWLGLEPVFDNRTLAPSSKQDGAVGFRYLMLMAYISLGAAPPPAP